MAALLAAVALTVAALPGTADAALPRWRGGIDLYRSGVFTTQKAWHWCTAADVQIIRNIVDHQTNHKKAQQRRFFDYLDQPIERVTGGEAAPSISKVLERAAIARTEEVVAGLKRVAANFGGGK